MPPFALRPWLAPGLTLLLGAALSCCGAERDLTGVWQQICDPEEAPETCRDWVFELHLGRYGSQVSGLVVRYHFEDVALDPYQRSDECGCFFIESGRAGESTLGFALHQSEDPGIPDPEFRPGPACPITPALTLPPECPGRRFELREEDGALVGRTVCGTQEQPLRLRRIAGRPRTACERLTPERP